MHNSTTLNKLLSGRGRCNALLTFAMLLLLTITTSSRAAAKNEEYTVLDNGILTFYCDDQKATRSGMPLNEGNNKPEWFNNAADITTVVFDQSFQLARPKTCYCWFYKCEKLTEIIGIEYLNTSEVTNISGMFVSCSALESLDLSSFNTSAVTDMTGMFNDCSALETILVGDGWNVEKVTVSTTCS